MKSDGFGIFLAGFFRFILHRNLKIALVLGVVCIGVKGFFFGLLFLLLLCESVEAAACRQRNQHDHTQKAGCDLCDLVFLGLFLAGCCRFFGGFFTLLPRLSACPVPPAPLLLFQRCRHRRHPLPSVSKGPLRPPDS